MSYPTREESLELTPQQRLQRIDDVWETLEAVSDDLPLSTEHSRILDERLASLERDPENVMSREEMMLRVRQLS